MRLKLIFLILCGMTLFINPNILLGDTTETQEKNSGTPRATIQGCPTLPADNIWNTPIDTLPVDANSDKYINTIGADRNVHADFGSGLWDGGPIGIPYVVVSGSQPMVAVTFDYDDESDPGPYPIPSDAPIEGGSESDGDRHVLVLDKDNCMLYELYYAFPQGDGSWTAGSGAIYNLNSNALRPAGWTSADAAGLPILPGLVRYDEVAAGKIEHAIRFTVPQTQRKYVWPARHYASSLTGSQYPPMGQRFRLKANFDISGYSPKIQVILKALKTYGMILADNGSALYISGVPDERWDNDMLHQLDNVTGADFEAVDVSSLMKNPNSGAVKQDTPPVLEAEISVNRERLNFGAVLAGTYTGEQTFLIENSGSGSMSWTVSTDAQWLRLTPGSGSDSGTVSVSIDASELTAGSYTASIEIESSQADNSPQSLPVYLTVVQSAQDSAPIGSFDSPTQGETCRSSIAVTGWALDDIAVESVKIYRQTNNTLTYIGDAMLVEGARPDVAAANPTYPYHFKGGWGYMLLSNFLPNQGNGIYTLVAIARDGTGNETVLGSKTITCDNANAVKPFGAIDTPTQGGMASGSEYINFGWALTPLPNTIPVDGSTIDVFVDGVNIGNPVYNNYRADIATLFPDYNNANGAVGYFYLDTTAYSNGVHIISWRVRDNGGNSDGIGSRYFSIMNSGNRMTGSLGRSEPAPVLETRESGSSLSFPSALKIRKGFNDLLPAQPVYLDSYGIYRVTLSRMQRLVIEFSPTLSISPVYPLPVGATFDAKQKIFYWYPGPAFRGDHNLTFISGIGTDRPLEVVVTIE